MCGCKQPQSFSILFTLNFYPWASSIISRWCVLTEWKSSSDNNMHHGLETLLSLCCCKLFSAWKYILHSCFQLRDNAHLQVALKLKQKWSSLHCNLAWFAPSCLLTPPSFLPDKESKQDECVKRKVRKRQPLVRFLGFHVTKRDSVFNCHKR